jgi:hypothetical protein
MYDGASMSPEDGEEYDGLGIETYKRYWQEYVSDSAEPRRQSFIDQDYYDGDVTGTGLGHYTQGELDKFALRNQPPTVFNLIQRQVDSISGVEQRARSEPRAKPRTPKDQKGSEVGTDVLRFVKDQSRLSMIKANAFLDALKSGTAAVEIGSGSRTVPISQIESRDFFYDPRSRRYDFSDARFLGSAKWLDEDVALSIYLPPRPQEPPPIPEQPAIPEPPEDPYLYAQWEPLAMQAVALWRQQAAAVEAAQQQYERDVAEYERIKTAIQSTMAGSPAGELADSGWDDLPNSSMLGDTTRRRVFVIDMWHRDPKKGWFRCVFTGGGKLFTEAATVLDDMGRPTHPIVAFSLYVSRRNWRYGVIRNMRSPQDETNKRRSKSLHLLTTNQIIMEQGASVDGNDENLRAEAARPDGKMVVRPNARFELVKNLDLAQGQKAMGDEAKFFLENLGPNPQLRGEQGQASSGRAILALQQAGLGALGPVFDRFYDWELRVYRAIWSRIKQFWNEEMYVRITDDEGQEQFVGVNGARAPRNPRNPPQAGAAPVMPGGPGAMPPTGAMAQPMMGHNGGPMMEAEDMGEPGPMLGELDFDIVIDRSPEAATLQAEQFETLGQLAASGMPIPPDVIIEASSLPNKQMLLDKLKKAGEGPNPQQQAQMEEVRAKLAEVVASVEKMKSETRKNDAQTAQIIAETRNTNADTTLSGMERTAALMRPQAPSAPPAATGDFGPPL